MNLRTLLKSNSKSTTTKAAAATVALCLLAPASYAQTMQDNDQEGRKVESTASTIQEAVDAAGQNDAAVITPESAVGGVVTSRVRDGTVEITKDGSDASAVLNGGEDGLRISLGLPTAEDAKDARVSADGTTIFTDPNGLVDVGVQTLNDGAVRALTVINNSEAPVEYEYQIDVEAGVVLEPAHGGAILFKGRDGSSEGAILPAWAVDANGSPVKTHYVITGRTVTQVIEHKAEGVSYPVVADPKVYYAWWQLFTWSEWRWNGDYRMNQLSIALSAWGRHDVIFNAGQFLTSGWNLLKQKHSSWIFTDSMRQQWECHVLGGLAEWGTFDLEYERPSNPNWRSRIGAVWPLSATCNW